MQYLREVAPNQGITCTTVDITDIDQICNAISDNTKLVYFEPMSNPTLIVADVGTIATRVHAVNPDIVVAVDNTFFSPYNFRPLDVGVDISINSATKYINGHCDVTMGVVACNSDILKNQMHRFGQWTIGAVPSPFDCFLANRGLKTLHVRMPYIAKSAKKFAEWLESNDRIEAVTFPGLPSHPQYQLVKSMCRGVPGIIAFRIKGDLEHTMNVLKNVKIFALAFSLGGFESLLGHPASMTHGSVPAATRAEMGITDNLVRASIGLEDVQDLINDLDQALKAGATKPAEVPDDFVASDRRISAVKFIN